MSTVRNPTRTPDSIASMRAYSTTTSTGWPATKSISPTSSWLAKPKKSLPPGGGGLANPSSTMAPSTSTRARPLWASASSKRPLSVGTTVPRARIDQSPSGYP